jgi:hypothetical protein
VLFLITKEELLFLITKEKVLFQRKGAVQNKKRKGGAAFPVPKKRRTGLDSKPRTKEAKKHQYKHFELRPKYVT